MSNPPSPLVLKKYIAIHPNLYPPLVEQTLKKFQMYVSPLLGTHRFSSAWKYCRQNPSHSPSAAWIHHTPLTSTGIILTDIQLWSGMSFLSQKQNPVPHLWWTESSSRVKCTYLPSWEPIASWPRGHLYLKSFSFPQCSANKSHNPCKHGHYSVSQTESYERMPSSWVHTQTIIIVHSPEWSFLEILVIGFWIIFVFNLTLIHFVGQSLLLIGREKVWWLFIMVNIERKTTTGLHGHLDYTWKQLKDDPSLLMPLLTTKQAFNTWS